jgi:hypothetical protein
MRKLVLKRKKPFGSETERGAKALEVVLSVCFSLWNRNPRQFLELEVRSLRKLAIGLRMVAAVRPCQRTV